MSNIQKLFSEKIEIFSAVEFSKVSVMTGIIKISLKVTLMYIFLFTNQFSDFVHAILILTTDNFYHFLMNFAILSSSNLPIRFLGHEQHVVFRLKTAKLDLNFRSTDKIISTQIHILIKLLF